MAFKNGVCFLSFFLANGANNTITQFDIQLFIQFPILSFIRLGSGFHSVVHPVAFDATVGVRLGVRALCAKLLSLRGIIFPGREMGMGCG